MSSGCPAITSQCHIPAGNPAGSALAAGASCLSLASAATVALTLLFSFAFVTYGVKSTWLEMGVSLASISLGVFIFIRYGLVAAVVAVATGFLFSDVPWTTDLSTWFAPQTIMGWVIVTAFLVYGFVTAIGGRQLFRDPLSDPVGMTPRRNT